MTLNYQTSTGTITGRAHLGSANLLVGQSNQDSYMVTRRTSRRGDYLLACVADGCSSGEHSEFGAILGTRLMASIVDSAWNEGMFENAEATAWRVISDKLTDRLRQTVRVVLGKRVPPSDAELLQFTEEHMLFTLLGALVTNDKTYLFAAGDGLFLLNGRVIEIGPFENNAPPYIGYNLLAGDRKEHGLSIELIEKIDTSDLESIVVATDGAQALVSKQESCLPGKTEKVGPIEKLWSDPRFFDGSGQATDCRLLTNWLRLLNSEVTRIEGAPENRRLSRSAGLLHDDTTMIVIRRADEIRAQEPTQSSTTLSEYTTSERGGIL